MSATAGATAAAHVNFGVGLLHPFGVFFLSHWCVRHATGLLSQTANYGLRVQ